MAGKMALLLAVTVLAVLACLKEANGACDYNCPQYVSPICGRDSYGTGTTSAFINYCEMQRFNCRNNKSFVTTSRDLCPALKKQ
ncbi:Kazal peptide Pr13a-like [Schistocerca nitens]|uniref:Kazal peptide Pr13a-like n=1 Tax=Schistocerca nitens TaxID=7011 RepID=UPI002118EE39|nr:Kazal peptide Pr13a-like [Schistocerca nitens]